MPHNFRELIIWKSAMSITKNVYGLTTELPKHEAYSLVSQMNRCAVSIASNIAEGSGRSTTKDFLRFLHISLSSSYELETQLILVKELYKLETTPTIGELNELQKMIKGFQRTLVQKSKVSQN